MLENNFITKLKSTLEPLLIFKQVDLFFKHNFEVIAQDKIIKTAVYLKNVYIILTINLILQTVKLILRY